MRLDLRQALTNKLFRLGAFAAIAAITLSLLGPLSASALQLTARSLTLSSSSAAGSNSTTTYTFNFTTGSTATIASLKAEICDAPTGTCNHPGGFDQSSSTLTSTTLSGSWTVSTATSGELRASATGASSTSAGVAKQIIFGSVQNPTTANQTFYARITTYTGSNWSTGPTDTGVVAASTASQITLTGTMDETLTFCVGTSITGQNCGTISGTSINFGSFSSSSTSQGTSVMAAASNAVTGYNITVNGTTLTCGGCSGSPTIAALSSQTASATGGPQFGFNLKSNATPSFGANPSGDVGGTATGNYGTADQYRFVTGDSVASSAGGTNGTTYTSAYIVNVPAKQPAGTYNTTLTYICTANY